MKNNIVAVLLLILSSSLHAQEKSSSNIPHIPKVIITQIPIGEPDEIYKPAKDDVICGDSEFKIWNFDSADNRLTFGIWESTPGIWKYRSGNWEYCRILSGKAIISEQGGKSFTVKAGDSFLLKPDVDCVWEVLETIRKDFVSYNLEN